MPDKESVEAWEYTMIMTRDFWRGGITKIGIDPTMIWSEQYKDGSTDWDSIKKHGTEGWEMVSAVYVTGDNTSRLLFIFKRRVRSSLN